MNSSIVLFCFFHFQTQNEAYEWKPDQANEHFQKLNAKNKLMYMWFVGKCQQDQTWCL